METPATPAKKPRRRITAGVESDGSPPLRPVLRYSQPGVARMIASLTIFFCMDFDQSIHHVVQHWKLTEAEIADYVEACEKSELIRKFIEEEMSVRGDDTKSRVAFKNLMWNWLYHGTEQQKLRAATIFGKGFIGEKIVEDKPEPLPIEGLKEGMERMLGGSPPPESDEPEEPSAIVIPEPKKRVIQ